MTQWPKRSSFTRPGRRKSSGIWRTESCIWKGYDDLEPAARRAMKRQENKLVKELSRRFDLGKLGRVKNVNKRK